MSETMSAGGDRNVSFGESVSLGLANFFNFNGRSSRGAYWWWSLAIFLVSFLVAIIDMIAFPQIVATLSGNGPVGILFSLATLIPGLSLSVRRLHDTGHSGWWLLIVLTVIGVFLILFWTVQPGQRASNKFGPDVEAGR